MLFRRIISRATPAFRATTLNPRFFSQASRFSVSKGFLASVGLASVAAGLALSYGSSQALVSADDTVPLVGQPGSNLERTFIAIKPDGVQRAIVGEVISRFEKKGYKLVAIKMLTPTVPFAEEHYSDLSNKPFFSGLVKYFSSGPVVAMVWEGRNVIKGGRKLVGATNPDDSEPGSIRGDLCIDVGRNIIHGSDSPASAAKEIKHWFSEKEAARYRSHSEPWIYS
eukprot:TRINITY_DN1277_c0_g1_i1.p1 TRINITY_DN1277_c0_g1~~TRINITY_DN1277_c0_g1_i1.p1  ORF type:complete len:225 (+),score=35.31 TRINITY_DN1277_c0_g1_i1:48-722(+)